MKFALALVSATFVGVAAGIGSMLYYTGLVSNSASTGDAIQIGTWSSNFAIGANAVDPYTKARVARFGLLALRREEAVYFTATRDVFGDRLSENCTYVMQGRQLPGEWWSFTVYDETGYLPVNTDDRLSFDATAAKGTDTWTAVLSPTQPATDTGWISTQNAGNFDVTMRIYLPHNDFLSDPERVLDAPVIKPTSCSQGE